MRWKGETVAGALLAGVAAEPRPEVTLTDFEPEGEVKVVAAALYGSSFLPDDQLLAIARGLSSEERQRVREACVGERGNRRHKPGRGFERTAYRFDILGDYGAFRDLQRHRMLTLEWQPLSPRHGWVSGPEIEEAGALDDWQRVMDGSAGLHDALVEAGCVPVAPYAVPMAYRVRYYMAPARPGEEQGGSHDKTKRYDSNEGGCHRGRVHRDGRVHPPAGMQEHVRVQVYRSRHGE